jgi:hypothetical protein
LMQTARPWSSLWTWLPACIESRAPARWVAIERASGAGGPQRVAVVEGHCDCRHRCRCYHCCRTCNTSVLAVTPVRVSSSCLKPLTCVVAAWQRRRST